MSESPINITVTAKGPYRVEAGAPVLDSEGNPIETREDKAFFLCRCGQSSNKPFCDGTHNSIEWDPTLASRDD